MKECPRLKTAAPFAVISDLCCDMKSPINLGISFYFLVFGMFYKIIIFELRSVFYVIFIDVNYNLMEDLRLITYESPVAEVIEVMLEGIVCDSGEVPDMGHGWDLDF